METILSYLVWKTIGMIVLILSIFFGFYKLFKQVEKENKKEQKIIAYKINEITKTTQ